MLLFRQAEASKPLLLQHDVGVGGGAVVPKVAVRPASRVAGRFHSALCHYCESDLPSCWRKYRYQSAMSMVSLGGANMLRRRDVETQMSTMKYSAKIEGWGFEQVDEKPIVIYSITVTSSNGHTWIVRRRYSEFRDNFLTMGYQYPKSKAAKFTFPNRTIFSSVNQADERQDLLQKYLNSLFSISPIPIEVQYFLRITLQNVGLNSEDAISSTAHFSVHGPSNDREGDAISSDGSDADEAATNGIEADARSEADTASVAASSISPAHEQRINEDTASTVAGDDSPRPRPRTAPHPNRSNRDLLRQLRRGTLHTKATLRPYSMKFHETQLEEMIVEDDFGHDTSKVIKPGVAVVLTVFGSFLCYSRIIIHMLSNVCIHGYFFFEGSLWKNFIDFLNLFKGAGAITWIMKTCAFCIVMTQVFHRLLGYLVTMYLQELLATDSGAFKMSIKSIVIRLGIIFNDTNEILVNNFKFHNPPKFTETPYFAKIRQLRLKFCVKSLWNAIFHRGHLVVWELDINGLTVHMEKGKRAKDGLNLWQCLDITNAEDEKMLRSGFTTKLAAVAKELGGGITHLASDAASGIKSGVSFVGHGIGIGVSSVGHGVSSVGKGIGTGIGNLGKNVAKSLHMGSLDEDEKEEAEDAAAANADGADYGLPSDGQGGANSQGADGPLEFHWGVPYKIMCYNFLAKDLTFYIKDFLAATHTEQKPIVIKLMGMKLDDLTGRPDHSKGQEGRQPLWLDDMLWRVINNLITTLLKGNSFGLLGTLAGSGINQAGDKLMSTARTGASKTIQGLYNYNPKEVAAVTLKGLYHIKHLGAPKLTRSPSMQDLKVDTLTVTLIAIRGLKIASGHVQTEPELQAIALRRAQAAKSLQGDDVHTLHAVSSHEEQVHVDDRKDCTCTCAVKMELKNQPGKASEVLNKLYQYKSGACVPSPETDDEGRVVYEFCEAFDIENLITLNAELYLRVFESSLIKDTTLGEITLPLKDDTISAILSAEAGRGVSSRMVDQRGVVQSHHHPQTKYLFGVREDVEDWYLLYAKGSDEVVGEVQLRMRLWCRGR